MSTAPKAQVSMEFMVFVSVLILITAIATVIAVRTSQDAFTESVNRDAKAVTETIATEVNIAAEVGPGYSHAFQLPQSLQNDVSYSVQIINQKVYVFWQNRSYGLPVLAYNITGLPHNGTNSVRNSGGVIIFG